MATKLDVADDVFLNFLEQKYLETGTLPSRELCLKYGFDNEWYNKLKRRGDYRDNLIARGVREQLLDQIQGKAKDNNTITELQLTAVNVMLDLRDNRSQKKKLTELGVSTAKWNAWMRDPIFKQYLVNRAESLIGDSTHEAHYALLNKVRAGDISAIKLYYELTGRHTSSRANDASNVDIKLLLTRILEAIQKHVKDPETLQKIGDEILSYAQVAGVVNKMIEPINIPVPAIPVVSASEATDDYSGVM